MTKPKHCFSETVIESVLREHGDLEVGASLENHLGECDECRKVLRRLAGDVHWWNEVNEALQETKGGFAAYSSGTHEAHEEIGLLGPTDNPEMLGRIGPYEVVGILGRGGMGVVFKAYDAGLNRFVAIKLLLPHLAALGAARTRFRREGQAAAAVVNDHVLPIYTVDEWRGAPYLVMRYIRGTTLQRKLSDMGPLELKELLRISLHAATGLAAAHAQGLVHRDIKPSNILLEGNVERAILCDFGLARTVDDASLTRSGMLAGTPQYMSPEQVQGLQLDQRSDLFSLGAVMYALCTGHSPFRAESSYAVMRRITDESPRSIREIRNDIPEWLESLVFWLMEKNPMERPESAELVESLLRRSLAHVEQPLQVSLPAELAEFQVTKVKTGHRRVMMSIAGSALLGFLVYAGTTFVFPVSPVPQEDAGAPNEAKVGNQVGLQKLRGETTSGGYRIRVLGIGSLDGMSSLMDYKPTIDNQSFQTNQFGNVATNQFGNTNSFNNQNGTGGSVGGFGTTTAGGGGSFGAGGGGATYSNVGIEPNCGIAFQIEPSSKQSKRKNVVVELAQNVKVTDIDGVVSESEDKGPLRITYPQFEKMAGTPFAAYLYRKRGTEPSIQRIEGFLKLTDGRLLEAEFNGIGPQTKRVGGEEFQLQAVQKSPQGLQVQVTFPETATMKKARNMFEKFEAFRTASNQYDLRIEDYQGNVYLPNGKGSSGGSSGSVQGFSFNGTTQTRTNNSAAPSFTTITFSFNALPAGTEVTKITAIMKETEGQPSLIPFSIEVAADSDE